MENLQAQIDELMAWKQKMTRQQITYPLDAQSINILSRYFPKFLEVINFTTPAGRVVPSLAVFDVNNIELTLGASPNLYPFNVNSSTDIFTATNHGFTIGDSVTVFTSDATLPEYQTLYGPQSMLSGNTYYVVGPVTPTSFMLSLSFGGTAMDIVTAGGTNQYIYYQI